MGLVFSGLHLGCLVIAYVLFGFALFSFVVSVDLLYVIALEFVGWI